MVGEEFALGCDGGAGGELPGGMAGEGAGELGEALGGWGHAVDIKQVVKTVKLIFLSNILLSKYSFWQFLGIISFSCSIMWKLDC